MTQHKLSEAHIHESVAGEEDPGASMDVVQALLQQKCRTAQPPQGPSRAPGAVDQGIRHAGTQRPAPGARLPQADQAAADDSAEDRAAAPAAGANAKTEQGGPLPAPAAGAPQRPQSK